MSGGVNLQVGLVVPPLPSPRYAGLELMLEALAKGLHQRGHDVLLHTVVDPMRTRQWASQVGLVAQMLHQATGVDGELNDCDIVHDHTLAGLFVRNLHHRSPLVTTNHGPFDSDPIPMYRRRPDDHVPMIAVSEDQRNRAPSSVTVSTTIHPAIDVSAYRYRPKASGYLLATGRMVEGGGVVESMLVSKATGVPLVIYSSFEEPAEADFFYQVVRPELGPDIQFVDDVSGPDRIDLFAGAAALIHPVSWPEPFSAAIVEAMACGTPTIATSGSAQEVIEHGRTGFVVDSIPALAAAVEQLPTIDRARCRRRAKQFFDCNEVAKHHEDFYNEVLDDRSTAGACSVGLGQTRDAKPPPSWQSAHI